MNKCRVCDAELPEGGDYCPAKQMEEGWFNGCYSIRFEMIWYAVRQMHRKSAMHVGRV